MQLLLLKTSRCPTATVLTSQKDLLDQVNVNVGNTSTNEYLRWLHSVLSTLQICIYHKPQRCSITPNVNGLLWEWRWSVSVCECCALHRPGPYFIFSCVSLFNKTELESIPQWITAGLINLYINLVFVLLSNSCLHLLARVSGSENALSLYS